MSIVVSIDDLTDPEFEEARIAFERAAKIVLDTSSFLELEPPATPAGLPLSINGLLTTFTEGITPNQRRLYYKAFIKTVELNAQVLSGEIPVIHNECRETYGRFFAVFESDFKDKTIDWKHSLEYSLEARDHHDVNFAGWLKDEARLRQLAKSTFDSHAESVAVLRMLDEFLKAAMYLVEEYRRVLEADHYRQLGVENPYTYTAPPYGQGAVEELHKLADRASRTA